MEADGFNVPARTDQRVQAAYRKPAICLPRLRLKWLDRLPQVFALRLWLLPGRCLTLRSSRLHLRASVYSAAENVI